MPMLRIRSEARRRMCCCCPFFSEGAPTQGLSLLQSTPILHLVTGTGNGIISLKMRPKNQFVSISFSKLRNVLQKSRRARSGHGEKLIFECLVNWSFPLAAQMFAFAEPRGGTHQFQHLAFFKIPVKEWGKKNTRVWFSRTFLKLLWIRNTSPTLLRTAQKPYAAEKVAAALCSLQSGQRRFALHCLLARGRRTHEKHVTETGLNRKSSLRIGGCGQMPLCRELLRGGNFTDVNL